MPDFCESKTADEAATRGAEQRAGENLPEVPAEELAFALAFFVGSANGQMMPTKGRGRAETRAEAREYPWRDDLLAMLERDLEPRMAAPERTTVNSLERTMDAVWQHYDGNDLQASLWVRVLNFYYLSLRREGTLLENWVQPCADDPSCAMLNPALVEALARVPVQMSGGVSADVFLSLVTRVAQTYAVG